MAVGRYYQTSDYITDVRRLIHDLSASDYTDAGLIPIINQARDRVAEDCRCVRQFITGLNTITNQEAYPLTDFVGGYALTSGGTNYTNPSVALVGGGGVGAAAVATQTSGVLTNISAANWGGGYTSTPGVTISDPTGSGAAATAIAGTNILDLYLMTALLSGTANPSTLALTFNWLPFDAFQAFCRSYRATYGWPGAFTVHYGPVNPLSQTANAQAVYLFPIPNQVMPLEWDAITLPNALENTATVDYWIVRPFTDAVQYHAAHLAFLGLQQYAQAQAMLGLYEGRCRQLSATVRARRVHNYYYSYRARMRRV